LEETENDENLVQLESAIPVNLDSLKFAGSSEYGALGMYEVLSEADRIRLSYDLLNMVKLKSMRKFGQQRFSKLEEMKDGRLLDFLRSQDFLQEAVVLHSRS